MNARQRKSLANYIGARALDLGLGDWDLVLQDTPPDNTAAAAEVQCIYGRRVAHIFICEDWLTQTLELQRQTILHELIHVMTDQTLTLVVEALPEALGKPAFHTFWEGYRQANEHSVDAIAAAIAEHYPLWEPPR